MRKILFGVAMSLVIGGVAYADDFIVVRSTDSRIQKSATFSAGERVYLAKGKTMTVINSAGSLSTYQGATGGIVLPQSAAPTDRSRFSGLLAMLGRPDQRRTFGAMRGGRYDDDPSCPKAADLATLDQILAADAEGCTGASGAAMDALTTSAQ